jgi:hypothetical protein
MTARMREPAWSAALTAPLAGLIPVGWRPKALVAIKGVHTAVFASVAAALGVFVWEGLRRRGGRRAAVALGIALGETAVYASNNQVCPLTPLAEALGAEDGSVADIFLPDRLARRIPLLGATALVIGLVLQLRGTSGRTA